MKTLFEVNPKFMISFREKAAVYIQYWEPDNSKIAGNIGGDKEDNEKEMGLRKDMRGERILQQ